MLMQERKAQARTKRHIVPTAQAMWSSRRYIFSRRTPTAWLSSSCNRAGAGGQAHQGSCGGLDGGTQAREMHTLMLPSLMMPRSNLCSGAELHRHGGAWRPAVHGGCEALHQPRRTLLVMRFSAASTTPSLARMPTQEPAFEMASMAYLRTGEQREGRKACQAAARAARAGGVRRQQAAASHSLYLVQPPLGAEDGRPLRHGRGSRVSRERRAASVRACSLEADRIGDPRHSQSHSAAPWLPLLLAVATALPGRALKRP